MPNFEPCQQTECAECNHIGDCANCPVYLWFKEKESNSGEGREEVENDQRTSERTRADY